MDSSKLQFGRRQFLTGSLAAAAGSMLPWDLLRAQTKDPKALLNIAYMSDVPTWDPTAVTDPQPQSIYESVFDSPLRYSPTLQLQGRQITSWKWQDKNSQRLEVTFRDDIYFHDGSKLTAEDLKWSVLDRPAMDKKIGAGAMFQTLKTVEILSPTHAVMVYNVPTPTAPIYLGFLAGYIVPKQYMQKVGDAGFLAKPIGAGPYQLVDYQRGSRIVLEAYDKYWGGAPAFKRVIFQITPEPSARVAAVESGRADIAVQIPVRETLRLAKTPGLTTKIYPYSEVYVLQIPNYVKPFDDDNVRAAMHYAIDTEALSKAFYGGAAKSISVTAPPGTPGDVPGFKVPFDPQKAIAALAKSGYGPNKPVKVPFLSTNGTFPSDYDMARAIAGMWQRVGIEAQVQETMMAKAISEMDSAKLTGCLLYSWANSTADPENYTGRMLDPNLPFSAWKEPALGPRIGALFTEVDETKRLDGYRALNREASEKSWNIPLLQSVTTIAYRSSLNVPTFGSGLILPVEYKPA
jgi:peptide/nickel transport system substrate-binding protein